MFHRIYLDSLTGSMHSAIFSNNIERVREILKSLPAGTNVDALLLVGVSPLQRASFLGRLEIVKLLVENGSNLGYMKNERTACDFAVENNHISVAEYLSQNMKNTSLRQKLDSLYEAIQRDDVLEFLIQITSFEYYRLFILLDDEIPEIQSKLKVIRTHIEHHIKLNNLNSVAIIQEVPDDGNCMYAASIAAANSDETIFSLREQVSLIIESDLEMYIPLLESQLLYIVHVADIWGFSEEIRNLILVLKQFDEDERLNYIREKQLVSLWIQSIKDNGFWGGEVELGVISILLGVSINVHMPDGSVNTINNTGQDDAPAIELSFSGRHYNFIVGYTLEIAEIEASPSIEIGSPMSDDCSQTSLEMDDCELSLPSVVPALPATSISGSQLLGSVFSHMGEF